MAKATAKIPADAKVKTGRTADAPLLPLLTQGGHNMRRPIRFQDVLGSV